MFGVNIWDYKWRKIESNIEVIDPIYQSKKYFDKYEIDINNKKCVFVAGAFSNLIWGFYVEELSSLSEAPLRT